MKYFKLLFLFALITNICFCQSWVQPRSPSSLTVEDSRAIFKYNLVQPRYVDTTAANLQLAADSCGAKIFTYGSNSNTEWVRMCSPKRWVRIPIIDELAQQSILQYRVDSTGTTDASNAIISAQSKRSTYYPKGRYRYSNISINPNFNNGIYLEPGAHINGPRYNDIVSKDENGNTIGLHYNFQEDDNTTLGSNLSITSGTVQQAPLSTKRNSSDISIIAHWYNDFGLESTRSGNGANGNLMWYYWNWAHTKQSGTHQTGYQAATDAYDSARHPMLGWYRGDDANVLDWQCYWLKEYGVTGVNIVANKLDTTTWQNPTSSRYWIYQLFHNVKNFKQLKYIMWGASGFPLNSYSQTVYRTEWMNILHNFIQRYNNYYYITKKGKIYPVLYLFEAGSIRGVLDNYNGSTNTAAFLKSIADSFKVAGFGGVAFFARNPTKNATMNYAQLENDDVIYIPAGYSNVTGVSGAQTYQDYVNNFKAPATRAVLNAVTSHASKYPHPSKWKQIGTTPALFEQLLKKQIQVARTVDYIPKVIEVYNVAEWAEGGPGLQPNLKDGFGYLQAVNNAVSENSASWDRELLVRSQFIKTDSIRPTAPTVQVYSDFSDPLDDVYHRPTIRKGVDGQLLTIMNNPTLGNYNLTFYTDNGTIVTDTTVIPIIDDSTGDIIDYDTSIATKSNGSRLDLTTKTLLLRPYDFFQVRYNAAAENWIEVFRSGVGFRGTPVDGDIKYTEGNVGIGAGLDTLTAKFTIANDGTPPMIRMINNGVGGDTLNIVVTNNTNASGGKKVIFTDTASTSNAFTILGFDLSTRNVGIGTNSPSSSSKVDITSTSKGILIPRMTLAQRNAIVSPAFCLMVIVTDNGGPYISINTANGTHAWQKVSSSAD